jgi:hypothetical protein
MDKKKFLFLAFCVVLISFSFLATKVHFHDVYEYITIGKVLGGVDNLNIYVTHSILYSSIISIFLKVLPSMLTIKFVNLLCLILISFILYSYSKDKKAFIIFIFSPIVWYLSIQITPIILASLFLLLAYIFIEKGDKKSFIISGICLGLSIAAYTPMLVISALFIITNFWKKKFNNVLLYLLLVFVGLMPRLILEMYFFGNPIYTFIRYFGARAIISIGLHEGASDFNLFGTLKGILSLLAISPLIYKLSSLKKIGEQNKLYFVLLSMSFLLIISPSIKYFFLLTPIIILLLSKILTQKEIKIHLVISLILIIFLTHSFFGVNEDVLIKEDIQKIVQDFEVSHIIAEPYKADKISTYLWADSPKVVWFMNYNAEIGGDDVLKSYEFDLNKNERIKTREIVGAGMKFKNGYSEEYGDYIFVSEGENKFCENCVLDRCYDTLCVYTPN